MYVETSAGRINTVITGVEGPTVVFLHGIPTHSYLWRNVVSLLPSFKTILIDLLGYGYSDKPSDKSLSLASQAGYVAEVLSKLGVESAHVVGHDIGGGVAQILAVSRPELVKSLVLIDSAGLDYWPIPEIARLKDPAWDRIVERIDLREGFMRGFMKGMVRKERVGEELVGEYVRPFADLEGRRAYLRAARALDFRDTMRIADDLKKLEKPALLIWGSEDEYLPPRRGEQLKQAIKDAKLILLSDAGHFSPEDQPEAIAAIIRGYIEILERR